MSGLLRESRGPGGLRAVALAGVLAIVFAYATVFYWTATIVGGRGRLVALFVLALGAATVMRSVDERTAFGVGGGAALVAGGWYTVAVMGTANPLAIAWTVLGDTLSLATGATILRIQGVDVWMQAVVPGPTFLAWYLAMRHRYVPAVGIAGGLLLLLVMTGDAPAATALLGVVGAVGAVGASELEQRSGATTRDLVSRDGSPSQRGVRGRPTTAGATDQPSRRDLLSVVAVVAASVTVVPAIGAGSGSGGSGSGSGGSGSGSSDSGGGPSELEGAVSADGELAISGEAELTPEPRAVITASEPRLWRTDAYDRYTGEGWLRTGDVGGPDDDFDSPPGETEAVVQRVELRSRLRSLPAAATPTEFLEGEDVLGGITDQGTLIPDRTLVAGDEYVVRSERPSAEPETLDDAGTDYPDEIEQRYTELPASTPSRVAGLTEEITAAAETPYQTALVVKDYLEEAKGYSLEVERPSGQIADQFLFEMEEGYCTYFATTMVVMLRTQDVPARMAVGYNTGERVDDDTFVVRGSDAHAWVEVYLPDVGWIEFDPTPSVPWSLARDGAIQQARQDDEIEVDTPETLNATSDDGNGDDGNATSTDGEGPDGAEGPPGLVGEQIDPTDPYAREGYLDSNTTGSPQYAPEEFQAPEEFDAERGGAAAIPAVGERAPRLALLAIVAGGAAAAVSGSERTQAAVGPVRNCFQRRHDPETDLERAIERLERVLADERVERRPDETDREYLDRLPGTVDPRVREVYQLRERARYAGEVDPELADRAVELVDGITRERVSLLGVL